MAHSEGQDQEAQYEDHEKFSSDLDNIEEKSALPSKNLSEEPDKVEIEEDKIPQYLEGHSAAVIRELYDHVLPLFYKYVEVYFMMRKVCKRLQIPGEHDTQSETSEEVSDTKVENEGCEINFVKSESEMPTSEQSTIDSSSELDSIRTAAYETLVEKHNIEEKSALPSNNLSEEPDKVETEEDKVENEECEISFVKSESEMPTSCGILDNIEEKSALLSQNQSEEPDKVETEEDKAENEGCEISFVISESEMPTSVQSTIDSSSESYSISSAYETLVEKDNIEEKSALMSQNQSEEPDKVEIEEDKVENEGCEISVVESESEMPTSELLTIDSSSELDSISTAYGTLVEKAHFTEENTWKESLQFHPVHGENIKLSEDRFTAQRKSFSNFFSKGIAFSSRSIGIGEKICIRFEEISSYWLSFFSFGFTNNDPATLARDLPALAATVLENQPGYWLGQLPKSFCKKSNIFYYYVNSKGYVDFGINGVHKGTLIWDVDTTKPIWAFVDIFGYFTAITFVEPRTPVEDRRHCSCDEKKHLAVVKQLSVSTLPRLKYQSSPLPLIPLNLHSTKGKNVQFMNLKSVVTRSDDALNQGYVFTQRPMYPGQIIVIQIISTGPGYEFLPVGVTQQDPSTLNSRDLPDNVEDLAKWGENWEVFKNVTNFLKYGDELAIIRTRNGEVLLKRNDGEPVKVTNVNKKIWLFAEVYGATKMVKLWTTKLICPCKSKNMKTS